MLACLRCFFRQIVFYLCCLVAMIIGPHQLKAQQDTVKQAQPQLEDIMGVIQKVVDKRNQQKREKEEELVEEEFNLIIVKETISKVGIEFEEFFYSYWEWPKNAKSDFTILITEQPLPRRGFFYLAKISVFVNEISVFENIFTLNVDQIEQGAKFSARKAAYYVANYNKLIEQLENGDQSGDGIY